MTEGIQFTRDGAIVTAVTGELNAFGHRAPQMSKAFSSPVMAPLSPPSSTALTSETP